ncbi:MAG: hypothetical protein NY202_03340 [Mollicutes bacterium UO1]
MKIKGLEEKIKQTVGRIPILEEDNQKKLNQISRLEAEITTKTNRIAQLDKLFKGTAVIFQKQHNYVDHLKQQLEKEKNEKGISQEQAQHLQEDIKRLNQQKQELDDRIKELEGEETKSKEARDKELADLRQERDSLKTDYDKFLSDIDNKLDVAIKTVSGTSKQEEIIKKAKYFVDNLKK